MTAHRWAPRGDAPSEHGLGCTQPDCCWTLLHTVTNDTQPEPAAGGETVWYAGWCTVHGETALTDAGDCWLCTGGDAA